MVCEQQNVLKTRKYGCLWIEKLPHTTPTAEAIPSLHLCDSHPLHTCLVAALLLSVSSQAAAHKGYNPNSSAVFHQRTLLCCKRFSGFSFNQFFCVVFLSLLQLGLGIEKALKAAHWSISSCTHVAPTAMVIHQYMHCTKLLLNFVFWLGFLLVMLVDWLLLCFRI